MNVHDMQCLVMHRTQAVLHSTAPKQCYIPLLPLSGSMCRSSLLSLLRCSGKSAVSAKAQ